MNETTDSTDSTIWYILSFYLTGENPSKRVCVKAPSTKQYFDFSFFIKLPMSFQQSPLLYECLFRSIIFYCVTSFVHKTKFVDNYNYTENTIILKYNITVVARVQFLLLYNWTLCFTERLLRSIYILMTFRDWVYIYWHFVKHSHYISIQQFQLNQGIQFWWDYQRSTSCLRCHSPGRKLQCIRVIRISTFNLSPEKQIKAI